MMSLHTPTTGRETVKMAVLELWMVLLVLAAVLSALAFYVDKALISFMASFLWFALLFSVPNVIIYKGLAGSIEHVHHSEVAALTYLFGLIGLVMLIKGVACLIDRDVYDELSYADNWRGDV
jgi:hypothetical protein